MAETAPQEPPRPALPPADPAAIRACLHPDTAAVFDAEWTFVLEEAKQSQNLTGLHQLLEKWRFFALQEAEEPGWYGVVMAKADRILRTGVNPGAVPWEDLQELLARRRGEQVYRIVPDAAIFPQVVALPAAALESYAELLAVLEVTPWNGPSLHAANPDGAVRRWSFGPDGAGQAVYLVLEDRREVHLLGVQWLG